MTVDLRLVCLMALMSLLPCAAAPALAGTEQTFRLYQGVTLYVNNPQGKDFDVELDVRDTNFYANGPREILCKVYNPDGRPVVREVIEDDGVVGPTFPDKIGGWDHELQYYANLYAKGTSPSVKWSEFSRPERLAQLKARTFKHSIKGQGKGVYRIMLAGTRDQYVTIRLSEDLKYGVAGHPTFMYGIGDALKKAYVYVPKGTTGVFFAVAEPDQPRGRQFKVTAPDGQVMFDGMAEGGYQATGGKDWKNAAAKFPGDGSYDGKLIEVDVSPGTNDYLIKITLKQPKNIPLSNHLFGIEVDGKEKGAFADYVGMGSLAVYCPDKETALAIQGGTFVEDGETFWHPFQARFHRYLKQHGKSLPDSIKADVQTIYKGMRLFEVSDGRGTLSWTNWAYAFGYYGCKIWRPVWLVLQHKDTPQELKDIIIEGVNMGGERAAFATGIEVVNGNAFAQTNVRLWYIKEATGDPLHKKLFETFWQRWTTEGWGPGTGISKSGDAQEHFSHDAHYGSYIMDNWRGIQWIDHGILDDAQGKDPRFKKIMDRYRNLYTYLYCEDKGRAVAANPWSTRTHMHPHRQRENWNLDGHEWRGEPGPDFTVSVNDGDEWFAARRKNYYMLTFHGRIAPEWMSRCFEGQLGFSGGTICQLTVPGKGVVLASTLYESYGKGMHPSNWRNFHVHGLAGEKWDGQPFIASISEHDDAKLDGTTVTSSGEVRDAQLRSTRKFAYLSDSIDCEVSLAQSEYAAVLSIWAHARMWSEVREAYEMIPYYVAGKGEAPTITLGDVPATKELQIHDTIKIDRGGFGVTIKLDQPRAIKLGDNNTVMIQLVSPDGKPVKAEDVKLKYTITPFGN